jgi:uncharacterized membrane protein
MLPLVFHVFVVCGCLGSAVIGGIFFAFSNFVMKALRSLGPAEGIRAMQSINVTVLNAGFLTLFAGTALISVAVLVGSFWIPHDNGLLLSALGATLYLLGVFFVTAAFNVPRNNQLAALNPAAADAAVVWQRFVSTWTVWNHVRTLAALGASAAFLCALVWMQEGR